MDIRTKLVIVLVAVSLLSMAVLGYFAYRTSADLLKEISARQLEALAQSKAGDVRKLITSWHDRVRLVASRTQLRINLQAISNGAGGQDRARLTAAIRRILDDAHASTPSVAGLAVYDVHKELVATAGTQMGMEASPEVTSNSELLGLTMVGQETVARFAAPLLLKGERVGQLLVMLDVDDIEMITSDYTGLGQYGETILATPVDSPEVRVLHELRHAPAPGGSNELVERAVLGEQGIFMGEHLDYRGAHVWGATRVIEPMGWGLVVQLDRSEELERTVRLRELITDLGLSLSAFAIFGGTLLGMYLARPIRKLAETVEQVRSGNVTLRADVDTEDEVGHLASAFNDFLDQRSARPDP